MRRKSYMRKVSEGISDGQRTTPPPELRAYLRAIAAKGGQSRSESKREAGRANIAKARARRAEIFEARRLEEERRWLESPEAIAFRETGHLPGASTDLPDLSVPMP